MGEFREAYEEAHLTPAEQARETKDKEDNTKT